MATSKKQYFHDLSCPVIRPIKRFMTLKKKKRSHIFLQHIFAGKNQNIKQATILTSGCIEVRGGFKWGTSSLLNWNAELITKRNVTCAFFLCKCCCFVVLVCSQRKVAQKWRERLQQQNDFLINKSGYIMLFSSNHESFPTTTTTKQCLINFILFFSL